jgi:hypothetical protein
MVDLIVECKGGVVQEVTLVGNEARVFVIDWDEDEHGTSRRKPTPWPTQRGVESLASETRTLYEAAICSGRQGFAVR